MRPLTRDLLSVLPLLLLLSVKEACVVLCLSVGSAILLRNVLEEEAEEEREAAGVRPPTLQATLQELGVHCLAAADVLLLLKLRVSWPGQ